MGYFLNIHTVYHMIAFSNPITLYISFWTHKVAHRRPDLLSQEPGGASELDSDREGSEGAAVASVEYPRLHSILMALIFDTALVRE